MGLFSTVKILFGAAKKVKESRAQAAALSQLPMETFLPKWAETLSRGSEEVRPKFRKPASEDAIKATEARIGESLPDEMKDFYRTSNGVGWPEGSFMSNIASLDELRPSSAFIPPLSAQLLADWEEWGKEQEEPKGLRVFANDFADLLSDTPERTIPFSDVDYMIALETPDSGQAAVIVIKESRHFAKGTVLAVENLQATRFENLRAWMASTAGNLTIVSRT